LVATNGFIAVSICVSYEKRGEGGHGGKYASVSTAVSSVVEKFTLSSSPA
jgi:hypothetical protein